MAKRLIVWGDARHYNLRWQRCKLVLMLFACIVFLFGRSPGSIEMIDHLAQARDSAGLASLAQPQDAPVFRAIKFPGAYGGGSKGWRAYDLSTSTPEQSYVVFTTPLTIESYGDLVFEKSGEKLGKFIPEEEALGVRLNHLEMDVRFLAAESKTLIAATATFEQADPHQRPFLFRVGPEYHVRRITTASGTPVDFHQAGGVIALRSLLGPKFKLKIEYDGTVSLPGYGGVITKDEAMLTNSYWWPSIARQPITSRVTIHCPPNWSGIANGDLTADIKEGDGRLVTYQNDVPISYLSLSCGPFKKVQRVEKGITYFAWSTQMSQPELEAQLELMPPIIEFYKRFAPFPYKRFGSLVTPLYVGGAMEAYSYATYQVGWLPAEDAHEPSHTWFGGVAPNSYLKSFWNEAFANFCDDFYQREVNFGDTAQRRLAFVGDSSPDPQYDKGTCWDSGSLTGDLGSDLGYGKGAKVLQQLEVEMGSVAITEVFKKFLAHRPTNRSAEWPDFEAACGPEWKWFFDQWLRRPGVPLYKIENLKFASGQVEGDVTFTGAPYRLKLEVLVEIGAQRALLPVTLNPSGTAQTSHFTISVGAKPSVVSFDPYSKLLSPVTGSKATLRLASHRKVVVDRAHPDWSDDPGVKDVPSDLNGYTVIGHPVSLPIMKQLCEQAGFSVVGNDLTYQGTKIDLRKGSAAAVVDLGEGRQCVIKLGHSIVGMRTGNARTAVCDAYGRFLAGKTDPRLNGALSFHL